MAGQGKPRLAVHGGTPVHQAIWKDDPFHHSAELRALERVLAGPRLPLARGQWCVAEAGHARRASSATTGHDAGIARRRRPGTGRGSCSARCDRAGGHPRSTGESQGNPRHHWPPSNDAGDLRTRRATRRFGCHSARSWRKRDRQRACCLSDPSQQPSASRVLRQGQLRGSVGEPTRIRVVRAREGCLHRRPVRQGRSLRTRSSGHDFPR